MPATIKLRIWQVQKYMALSGLRTKSALAEHMRIDRATVQRVFAGDALPGATFIAAMLAAFPELAFEDLFDVTLAPRDEADTAADDPGVEHEVAEVPA